MYANGGGGVEMPLRGLGLAARAESEVPLHGTQGIDHELDVRVQLHAELLGALADVLAAHAARERLVLEFLLDGAHFEVAETAARSHQRARDQGPAQPVHREPPPRHGRFAWLPR